jgi:hypothetical protein
MSPDQYQAVWNVLVIKGRQWLDQRQAEERESEGQGDGQARKKAEKMSREVGSGID